jgi:predicted double-glycine peptidase
MPRELPLVEQSLDFTCGAACFESLYRYFRNVSLGELHFAKELGSLDLGYTPVENVVALARHYGFQSELKSKSTVAEVKQALCAQQVAIVTWWDEDAGHYSLVKSMDETHITLMDPWKAREGTNNPLLLEEFIPLWQARGAVLITVCEN